jgi:hypothetical protein
MNTSTKHPSNYNEDDPCDEWKELDKLHEQDTESTVRPVKRNTSRSKRPDN